ncbi:hypothetical protein A0H81_01201 [Grifola frondosa]|uniref:Uncharacterized protein n=1 Tax=Grifola frondosa TaxID=5627 RepID=A0A1C7MRM1_GRIFR|nr:hypothetical protein A0H81_01201 [Grifola frondosa]
MNSKNPLLRPSESSLTVSVRQPLYFARNPTVDHNTPNREIALKDQPAPIARYHPYGRYRRPGWVDLMQTVDLRYEDDPGRFSVTLSVVIEEDEQVAGNLATAQMSGSEGPTSSTNVFYLMLLMLYVEYTTRFKCSIEPVPEFFDRTFPFRLNKARRQVNNIGRYNRSTALREHSESRV